MDNISEDLQYIDEAYMDGNNENTCNESGEISIKEGEVDGFVSNAKSRWERIRLAYIVEKREGKNYDDGREMPSLHSIDNVSEDLQYIDEAYMDGNNENTCNESGEISIKECEVGDSV